MTRIVRTCFGCLPTHSPSKSRPTFRESFNSRTTVKALHKRGYPRQQAHERAEHEFLDSSREWRRFFSECWGTFLLVVVAAGAHVVAAQSNGKVTLDMIVVAPGLMVMAIIYFMGTVSGAHLNPAVTLAFALRRNFPWSRVPGYIVAQLAGGVAAAELLALFGKPLDSVERDKALAVVRANSGIASATATAWEWSARAEAACDLLPPSAATAALRAAPSALVATLA